ncbi:MAG: MmgE/PrpD family protein [Betaproteobacteria bacterium]|nr:MmgE/PrpD family protein [Betaproteobacteria bacterium]
MTLQRDLAWQQLELTYRSSVSHQFARYALALNYSALSPDVVHQAKRCVLDALGCAIGAYDAPGRTVCEATVNEIGGPQEATVFCSGLRTSALNAALVNSFLVRFLDYNDCGGGGHNSDALASILAVAEREKASGRDFLTALVVSYELGARFQESVTTSALKENSMHERGWTTDVRAGLNQPPALGKLMGLTEEQIANAIGVCVSHTLPMGILDSNRDENVMAKNLRFGWAAHDAILACMLAKNGFTGPIRIVESDVGIRKVIAQGEMDLERLMDFSGWRMLDVRFKAMPANATTHAHVFSTLGIVKEQNLKPEDIAAVRIRASVHESCHTTTPAKKYPRNAESADHSAFYANALAIKERAFGPESINPEKFTDPVVLDLIEKITVVGDPSLGRFQGASEIVTKDGRCFHKRIDVAHGRAEGSLTDKELEEKFTEMASKHMRGEHIRRILDACWNVDKIEDVCKLTKLMIFPRFNP